MQGVEAWAETSRPRQDQASASETPISPRSRSKSQSRVPFLGVKESSACGSWRNCRDSAQPARCLRKEPRPRTRAQRDESRSGPFGHLLRQAGIDRTAFLHALEQFLQPLMECAVTAQISAPRMGAPRPGPRSAPATGSGRGPPGWARSPGQIPQPRQGNGVPEALEPRRRSAQVLTAVVPDAQALGVSPRNVDASGRPWGGRGSASQRSRRTVRAGMSA